MKVHEFYPLCWAMKLQLRVTGKQFTIKCKRGKKKSRPHDFQSPTLTSCSAPFLYLSFSISLGNFHILALWLSLSGLTAKCFCLAMLHLKHMGSTGDEEGDWECAELIMVRAQDRKNGSKCSPSVLKTIKNGGSVFIYSISNLSQRSPYLPQRTLTYGVHVSVAATHEPQIHPTHILPCSALLSWVWMFPDVSGSFSTYSPPKLLLTLSFLSQVAL